MSSAFPRRLGAVLFAAALTTAGAAGTATGATDPAVAKRHVNLAGLQSMLAEQMAKAACFAHLGVNAGAQKAYLAGAYDLFTRTHAGLREGNEALGLVAETNPNLLQALDRVDRAAALWRARIAAVAPLEAAVTADIVEAIARQTETVTVETEDLAERAGRTYGDGEAIPLALSLKIKLASRQRMLSQRIAKDFCLVAAGVRAQEARAALAEGAQLFATSLSALIDGFPAFGLAPEADAGRREALAYVRRVWGEIEPIVAEVAAGGQPSEAQIAEVAWANVLILAKTNAVVFQYETSGGAS